MKPNDSSTGAGGAGAGKRLLLLGGVLLFLPPLWAAIEVGGNHRGPGAAPPNAAAARAGRELLARALEAHDAAAWGGRPTVTFGLEARRPLTTTLDLTIEVTPPSRSARFRAADAGDSAFAYLYDGATKQLRAVGGDTTLARALRPLAPSIVFWSLVPHVLNDPTAGVWATGRVTRKGEERERLAVRWPGAPEWYQFEIGAVDHRVKAVEFISAGASPFIRWRGEPEGTVASQGVSLPARWRFRPASPIIGVMFAGDDVYVFNYRSAP